MQNNFWETVIQRIEFTNAGTVKELADGTKLIGHAPHIAPHAWVHNIYPVLNKEDVATIEKKLVHKIPSLYKEFLLRCSNGLSIFSDTLSLYGLRKRIGRGIEDAWQPYSIFTPNIDERLQDASANHFFIGGYNWDGSLLYIDTATNKVHRSSNDSIAPLNTWDDFEAMLLSETERIALLFKEHGMQKDEEEPTTP